MLFIETNSPAATPEVKNEFSIKYGGVQSDPIPGYDLQIVASIQALLFYSSAENTVSEMFVEFIATRFLKITDKAVLHFHQLSSDFSIYMTEVDDLLGSKAKIRHLEQVEERFLSQSELRDIYIDDCTIEPDVGYRVNMLISKPKWLQDSTLSAKMVVTVRDETDMIVAQTNDPIIGPPVSERFIVMHTNLKVAEKTPKADTTLNFDFVMKKDTVENIMVLVSMDFGGIPEDQASDVSKYKVENISLKSAEVILTVDKLATSVKLVSSNEVKGLENVKIGIPYKNPDESPISGNLTDVQFSLYQGETLSNEQHFHSFIGNPFIDIPIYKEKTPPGSGALSIQLAWLLFLSVVV
eukprot:Platyproteum_vivax@DN1291_c0_g1_i2.p1